MSTAWWVSDRQLVSFDDARVLIGSGAKKVSEEQITPTLLAREFEVLLVKNVHINPRVGPT